MNSGNISRLFSLSLAVGQVEHQQRPSFLRSCRGSLLYATDTNCSHCQNRIEMWSGDRTEALHVQLDGVSDVAEEENREQTSMQLTDLMSDI